MKSYQF